jgi:5-methylcytosine-specific restriction endonuclease McrA
MVLVRITYDRLPIDKHIRETKYAESKTCHYCGVKTTTKNRQLDHIIPVASGGTNEADTLVVACKRCNRQKGKMSHDEYIIKRIKQVNLELTSLLKALKGDR